MILVLKPSARRVAWFRILIAGFALLSVMIAAPAGAHKHHKKHPEQAQPHQQARPAGQTPGSIGGAPAAMHGETGEGMDDEEIDRSTLSFPARLLDWIGRLHPAIVHFPLAFFPAAAFTAIVGRRREAFAKPVRFLVIAGGIVTPIAATLGWLDAMHADPDPLLTVHRWLGTGIGIGGLALAIWAWLRPGQDRSITMITALLVITAVLIVQGWYGGAIVHGIDHLNW